MSQHPTPADVARPLTATRYQADMERARAEGKVEGRAEARKEFLDYLNKQYLNTEMVRSSPIAQAILRVSKELSDYFNGVDGKALPGGRKVTRK